MLEEIDVGQELRRNVVASTATAGGAEGDLLNYVARSL
ncbi:hypothetical protein ACVWZD_001098 [Streptomyces sp. TE3672]